MSASERTKPDGFIEPGVVYHVEEFKRRLCWSKHAMRTARRQGLRVLYAGGRAYVRGDDAISYLDRIGDDSHSNHQPNEGDEAK